jgi:ABC-2 type transport system ATP-binding protein
VTQDADAIKARLGVSLQSTALFPLLTTLELLEVYAAMYDRFPGRAALERLLVRFDLADKAKARAKELSGGQQQRLALAIALVNDPELVVLDEPTTGLDPQARRSIWNLITELRAEGRTVLLTTHYMEEAEALCGRVGIIDHGQILALDSPTALVRSLGDRATILATVELPLEQVRQLPGATNAHYVGERLEINSDAVQATAAALQTLALERGRTIRDQTIRQPNLEDVFITMTGRTIRS